MIKKAAATILMVCISLCTLWAQPLDTAIYYSNKRLIDRHLNKQEYAQAAQTVAAQIRYLESVKATDSLYRFVYKLGKSNCKTKGLESGWSTGENLVQQIMRLDADTAHWLQALNDMSWLYFETGNAQKCYETDLAYLELCKQYTNTTPIQLFTAHYSLGYDYLDFGKSNKSIYHIREALKALPENDTLYLEKQVNACNLLGSTLWRMGDLKGAKTAFESGFKYVNQIKDPYLVYSNRSNVYGNLGILAQDNGDLVLSKDLGLAAIEERKKAYALCKDPMQLLEHQKLLLVGYRNLASLYLELGDLSKSLQIVKYIKSAQEKLLQPDDPKLALNYEGLGAVYVAMDDPANALHHFGIYRDLCEKNYGKESFHTANAYKRVGQAYLEKGMPDEAIASYNLALASMLATDAENRSNELASIYQNRSSAFESKKDFENSAADLQKTIEIYTETRDELNPKLGHAYASLAEVYLKADQPEAALAAANNAIEVLAEYENIISKNKKFEHNNLIQYLPNAYYTKAKIHHHINAGEDDRKAVNENMNKALSLLRTNKNSIDSEDAMIMLYKYHQSIFNFAQELSYANYQLNKDERELARMFDLAEENKTILLRKHLNNFSSLKFHNVPDSIQERQRVLSSILSGKNVPVDSIFDPISYQQEYDSLLAYIKMKYPEYYQLRFQDETIPIERIKSELLKNDNSLIQYVKTEDNLFALVFTPEKNHLIKLNADNLNELVKNYVIAIKQPYIQPFVNASSLLYRSVFGALDSLITTTNLYIIPDDELFSINFETLVKSNQSGAPHYLIYDYNISYLLSATTAMQSSRLSQNKNGKLLAIAPGFTDDLKQEYLSAQQDSVLLDQLYLNCLQQPFAVKSANNLAGIFPGKVFTGKSATERQFKDNATEFGIIHFGTHTEINNASPMLSRLILSKNISDSTRQDDGYLHAYEIYNLPLRAELAVLTACETGVGKRLISEGILSIAHSFSYAGCPSVVMSLWQIDEKTSSGIIEAFYTNLAEGLSKSEALRQAKLSYLKNAKNEMAAPYFWAGMVLVGNTEPIEKTSHNFWWWLVPLVIAMLIFALVRFRKTNALSKAQ